ncbi:MAG: hypothetical protein M0R46_07460 [Candidatus Muirbacterium halophilum]|nr:hypothetical protein [Candidatus Muirbacterium halophilum]MCK9475737.1 hypothetical protein [Candidatus Muirbacterium halophilum]
MKFKSKIIFILYFVFIFTLGCKPYFMLDDKGKIERIIEKYASFLDSNKVEESFKLLTFIHDAKSKNYKMYEMAQNLVSNNYEETDYILKEITINNDYTASVELDMVFSSYKPVARKIKVETQFFMYKPENSQIWFIASGNEDSRKKFLNNVKESEGLKLVSDKTFFSWKGSWVEEQNIKFENGKTFLLKDNEWIEQN